MGRGQHGQGLAQLAVELLVGELDAADRLQRHRAEPVVGEQVEHLGLDDPPFFDLLFSGLDAHDDAADLVGRVDLDPLAADLAQQLAQRRVGGQIDGEALEGLVDGVLGAVADGRDLPAVEVLHDHALKQVVDAVHLEIHLHGGVALHLAGVLEEPDPGAEQHDPLQWQVGGGRFRRAGRRRRGGGRGFLFRGRRDRRCQKHARRRQQPRNPNPTPNTETSHTGHGTRLLEMATSKDDGPTPPDNSTTLDERRAGRVPPCQAPSSG